MRRAPGSFSSFSLSCSRASWSLGRGVLNASGARVCNVRLRPATLSLCAGRSASWLTNTYTLLTNLADNHAPSFSFPSYTCPLIYLSAHLHAHGPGGHAHHRRFCASCFSYTGVWLARGFLIFRHLPCWTAHPAAPPTMAVPCCTL